ECVGGGLVRLQRLQRRRMRRIVGDGGAVQRYRRAVGAGGGNRLDRQHIAFVRIAVIGKKRRGGDGDRRFVVVGKSVLRPAADLYDIPDVGLVVVVPAAGAVID